MTSPPPRLPFSIWLSLFIGTAVHIDWHLARPHVQHLSGNWPFHWVTAIPVFALAAWHITRRWPADILRTSAFTILVGLLLGQGAEPPFEIVFLGGTSAYAFSAERLMAFAKFTGVGLVTYGVVLALVRPRAST